MEHKPSGKGLHGGTAWTAVLVRVFGQDALHHRVWWVGRIQMDKTCHLLNCEVRPVRSQMVETSVEEDLRCILQLSHVFLSFIFLIQDVLRHLEHTNWLEWLVSKCQESFRLCLPSTEAISMASSYLAFCVGDGQTLY